MRKICFILCILSGIAISFAPFIKLPETEISNGIIHAHLYLPDADSGFYRGSRFDWSGNISSLEYKGHSYFGQWFWKYSPTNHDAIMGPVEVFDPLGYEQAKTGESFVKIGIGTLSKIDELPYNFISPYPILNPGKWIVNKMSDQVQFTHILNDKEYAYEYIKTVKLPKNRSELILTHSLKNTGKLKIETTVYNHNFFVIDKQPTGPDFVVSFPLKFKGDLGDLADIVKFEKNKLMFLKELTRRTVTFKDLNGGVSSNYDIKVENRKTGAGVRITGDRPIIKLAFWAITSTICPEPYIKIDVDPGQTFTWKYTYRFYTRDKTSQY